MKGFARLLQLNGHGTRKQKNQAEERKSLRQRAENHLEQGAITQDYGGDRAHVIELLNEALATEIVCNLRYKHDYYTAEGIFSEPVRDEFLEHAKDEEEHADRIAERIGQLGGDPNLAPDHLLERSNASYRDTETLVDKIRENLVAEREAIETYRMIARTVAPFDPTTRRLMESVLEKEEEHADDLATLLSTLSVDQPIKKAA